MGFTYEPAMKSDLFKVRFHALDSVEESAHFDDAEITALLGIYSNVHTVAAILLERKAGEIAQTASAHSDEGGRSVTWRSSSELLQLAQRQHALAALQTDNDSMPTVGVKRARDPLERGA